MGKQRLFQKSKVPRPKVEVPNCLRKSSLYSKRELEIGAGDGEFALSRSLVQPYCQIIAIEKTRSLFKRFLKKYQKGKYPNLWIFHTNAVWWLTHFASAKSLNKVYILYPNCYLKSRQANLRWINRPFMAYLFSCLKVKGELELRTNKKTYYREFKEKMQLFHFVQKKKDYCLKPPAQTAFERKYMAHHQTCYSLVYKRCV